MTIRLANAGDRAVLLVGDRMLDLERRAGGAFSSDPMDALAHWAELRDFAASVVPDERDAPIDEGKLGPCVPRPSKVFAVGLNYREHAREAGLELPKQPVIFTKFPSCLVGPRAEVRLTGNRVDFEVELVVVIGRSGRRIAQRDALTYVAGYCVGQDISDRKMQFADRPPQFSMGKSADTYGPIGPAVVSLDAFDDAENLAIRCDVNGELMQDDRTSGMIFSVPEQIEFLSRYCTLEAGDLIFTGTPAGVGSVREPRRYLADGDIISSVIEGVGALCNRCTDD